MYLYHRCCILVSLRLCNMELQRWIIQSIIAGHPNQNHPIHLHHTTDHQAYRITVPIPVFQATEHPMNFKAITSTIILTGTVKVHSSRAGSTAILVHNTGRRRNYTVRHQWGMGGQCRSCRVVRRWWGMMGGVVDRISNSEKEFGIRVDEFLRSRGSIMGILTIGISLIYQ